MSKKNYFRSNKLVKGEKVTELRAFTEQEEEEEEEEEEEGWDPELEEDEGDVEWGSARKPVRTGFREVKRALLKVPVPNRLLNAV
jgi:hypothetical protein